MNQKEFQNKLTELRTSKGLTQEEAASALGVSNKTLSKWENGSSAPDIEMLARVAQYYEISTDELLGLGGGRNISAADAVRREMNSLGSEDALVRSFELANEMLISGMNEIRPDSRPIPGDIMCGCSRNLLSSEGVYELVVNSDDLNLAVMMLGNRSQFSWFKEKEKRERIAGFFGFLSDEDTLRVCEAFHDRSFSACFTLPRLAEFTGVSAEKAEKLLDAACGVGLCSKSITHMKDGELTVYDSRGNGMVLSAISLVYEYLFGRASYRYYRGEDCKMIGGEEI